MSPARQLLMLVESVVYGGAELISGVFAEGDTRAGWDPFASPVQLHHSYGEKLATAPISAISAT